MRTPIEISSIVLSSMNDSFQKNDLFTKRTIRIMNSAVTAKKKIFENKTNYNLGGKKRVKLFQIYGKLFARRVYINVTYYISNSEYNKRAMRKQKKRKKKKNSVYRRIIRVYFGKMNSIRWKSFRFFNARCAAAAEAASSLVPLWY